MRVSEAWLVVGVEFVVEIGRNDRSRLKMRSKFRRLSRNVGGRRLPLPCGG